MNEANSRNNNSLTARKFGVNETTVRRYKKELAGDKEITIFTNKKQIRIRKPKYEDMEKNLMKWFIINRKNKLQLTFNDICNKAKEFGPENFKASSGWFANFKKLQKLSLRATTKIIQQIKDNSINEIKIYFDELLKFRFCFMITNKREPIIINFDETPLSLDNTSRKTYDFIGKKHIDIIKNSG